MTCVPGSVVVAFELVEKKLQPIYQLTRLKVWVHWAEDLSPVPKSIASKSTIFTSYIEKFSEPHPGGTRASQKVQKSLETTEFS